MRRRKVMLEQEQAQAHLEEKRREELLLAKLGRQCAEERKISEQIWQVRQQKAVMRENRAERERQHAEDQRQEELARIARNRELMGATYPKKADKGTIRADFADSIDANAVHGSDAPETAAAEVAFFFPGMDIHGR